MVCAITFNSEFCLCGREQLLADAAAEVECVDEFFDETDDDGDHVDAPVTKFGGGVGRA